ncbi:ABC transporter permease [Natronohydrobacter thiooxidans]|jgi:ABC-type nitrate/sulfonate/bicarbonate transport system permease component|uniref:ABC transporter permease n=1 Tax=Natronohydrobacter thiooxidans TaxID=87172 RepID=UPI0008FF74C9|nr:ABC transporter permease [Natronohydrobacter thiooxidans]
METQLKKYGQLVISLSGVVAVWWLVSATGLVNPNLFPAPPQVLTAAVELYQDGVLVSDLKISLTRAAVGFTIGASLGVLVGLLTARVFAFKVALEPFLTLLRPIPAIALVPIAIVWFGIGEGSKYFVIAYTVFLAVWLNTHAGASGVAGTYIRAARSLGASRFREFFEVVVPAAAPHIVVGLRLGAALAFLSLVAAELSGASSGIGFRLQDARQFIQTDRMFVGLIQLGILGALLDAVFVIIGRRLVHWESA